MNTMRLLKGFVALAFVTLATSQRFPTQHPFYPIAFLPEDDRSSSSESDFEPSLLPLQKDEQHLLKTIGSVATPTEITFDSYNAAFPAQLRPFWNEPQISGNENSFDDMLYPDTNDVTASIEHDNDADEQYRINTKNQKAMFSKKPTEQLLLLLLLKDANKHQRSAGASEYNRRPNEPLWTSAKVRQSGQLNTGWKRSEKRILMNDFTPKTDDQQQQLFNEDNFVKRNAFRNIKRQKSRSQDTRLFLPSISAGAMTHLGHFFKDLKSNVHFMENQRFGSGEQKLLEGDHPVAMLREAFLPSVEGGGNPTASETAAFLHAIRTYRPSQKIRSLVSMNPEGYHGSSQFLDPNYMWIGLGK